MQAQAGAVVSGAVGHEQAAKPLDHEGHPNAETALKESSPAQKATETPRGGTLGFLPPFDCTLKIVRAENEERAMLGGTPRWGAHHAGGQTGQAASHALPVPCAASPCTSLDISAAQPKGAWHTDSRRAQALSSRPEVTYACLRPYAHCPICKE